MYMLYFFSLIIVQETSFADTDCIHAPTPPSAFPLIYQKNSSVASDNGLRLTNDEITDPTNIMTTSRYVPNIIYYDNKNELSLLPPSRSYSITETDMPPIAGMEMGSLNPNNFTGIRRFRSEPSQENIFLGKFL